MTKLSQEDWQWLAAAAQARFDAARPKLGEPPASKEFREKEARVMNYLLARAFPKIEWV